MNCGSYWLWMFSDLNMLKSVDVCWIPAHSAQSLFHGTCMYLYHYELLYYQYLLSIYGTRVLIQKFLQKRMDQLEQKWVWHCVRLGTTWMRKKLWKNSSVRINSAITCFSVTSCVQWATYRLAGNGRQAMDILDASRSRIQNLDASNDWYDGWKLLKAKACESYCKLQVHCKFTVHWNCECPGFDSFDSFGASDASDAPRSMPFWILQMAGVWYTWIWPLRISCGIRGLWLCSFTW